MKLSRPLILWSAVICGALLLVATWSYWFLSDAREAALRSAEDVASCERLATQIRAARTRPAIAVPQESQAADLSRAVQAAFREAEIPSEALVRVSPEAPHRLHNSDYIERPTRVQLQNLTLAQFLRFVGTIGAANQGISVQGIRLTAATDSTDSGVWAADLTITSIAYAPKAISESIRIQSEATAISPDNR